MKIILSYRDVLADTKDVFHDTSETENNNPKHHQELDLMKPQIDVRIKLDKERVDIGENIAMPLNALNQLMRNQNVSKIQR